MRPGVFKEPGDPRYRIWWYAPAFADGKMVYRKRKAVSPYPTNKAKSLEEAWSRHKAATETTAPTLADYVESRVFFTASCPYSRAKRLKPSTIQGHFGRFHNYIIPQWGAERLDDLSVIEVENWAGVLPFTARTRNACLDTLRIVLHEAKREGVIDRNPLADVYRFALETKETAAPTTEEVRALFPEKDEDYAQVWPEMWHGAMFELMAACGIRGGEARALTYSSVNWRTGILRIRQAIDSQDQISEPKKRSVGSILIPARTFRRLEKLRAERPGVGEALLFTNDTAPIQRKTLRHYLDAGIERLNAIRAKEDLPEIPHLTPHGFRHAYVRRMRDLAVPDSLLQLQTRHAKSEMLDYYDGPVADEREKILEPIRERVDRFWA